MGFKFWFLVRLVFVCIVIGWGGREVGIEMLGVVMGSNSCIRVKKLCVCRGVFKIFYFMR